MVGDPEFEYLHYPLTIRRRFSEARALLETGDLENCLSRVFDIVREANGAVEPDFVVYGNADLDALCTEVGRRLRYDAAHATALIGRRPVHLYLATQLYSTGGHSRVIEDFVLARPEADHIVILTDIEGRQSAAEARSCLRTPLEVVRLGDGTRVDKVREGFAIVGQYAARHIFHFAHQFDVVAAALLQPGLADGDTFYVHHADHDLALGCYAAGVRHIDMHPRGYHTCKTDLGIANSYVPLCCRAGRRTTQHTGMFVTASSGTYHKFVAEAPMTFEDMVVERLRRRGGVHFHLGAIPHAVQDTIDQRCRDCGLPAGSFVNVSFVENFSESLAALGVDLYINSFPVGGGKAMIEAMAAAIPCLVYARSSVPIRSQIELVYKDGLIWRTTDEFLAIVEKFDDTARLHHSNLAHRHFMENYSVDEFTRRLDDLLTGAEPYDVPGLRPYLGTPFQGRFLRT